MLRLVAMVFAAGALLAGCATAPGSSGGSVYKAASSKLAYGYSDQEVGPLRYRVTFNAPTTTGAPKTQDYALLRAAELTSQKGHSWLQLAARSVSQVQVDKPKVAVTGTSSQGMTCNQNSGGNMNTGSPNQMGCSYSASNTGIAGADVNVVGGYDTRLIAIVEFVMGDGDKPAGAQVFDAKETAASLRASLGL